MIKYDNARISCHLYYEKNEDQEPWIAEWETIKLPIAPTMIYTILHRKLNIQHYETHYKLGVYSCAKEGYIYIANEPH